MLKEHMAPPAVRFFLLVTSGVLWLGIGLTGFSVAHWVLYIPSSFLLMAAITGICPGLIFSKMLFRTKN